MSKGVLYGVGTGPGDPELLTIKAVRTIESCPVIAAPQTADGVMKARRSLADTKRILREEGAFDGTELVEDCGLPGERVYRSLDDVPDRGSYFSTMVVR